MATKTVVKYRNRPVKKRRRKAQATISMSMAAGIIAGLYTPGTYLLSGDTRNSMRFLSRNYTGYDPMEGRFYTGDMKKGLVPLAVGALVHKIAGRTGINRALGRAGLPFIRI